MTYAEGMAWFRGFLEQHAPQSMTRAVALMCGIAGSLVSLGGLWLAHRSPITTGDVAMAHELYIGVGYLIGGGAVSLLARGKADPSLKDTP